MQKQKEKEQEVKIKFDPVLNRFIEEFKPFRPRKSGNRTHIHRVI